MPNRDGTGPFGDGRPGRGLGPCGRFERPCPGFGFKHRGQGGRLRLRQGWGQAEISNSRDFYPLNQTELQARKEELEAQLKWVDDQLKQEKE